MTDKTNEAILSALLRDPTAKVEPAWVMSMLELYPTFITPAVLLLKRNPEDVDEDTRQKLQNQIVLNCPDRTAVADFIDFNDTGWANFYPEEEPKQCTTEQTIDDFIVTFGRASTPEEDSILEKLIFNPAPADYFAGTDEPYDPSDPLALPPELMPDSDETHEDKAAEIEEEAKRTTRQKEEEETPATGDESLLMESLSKIFIKQHRYERAYEIISKLSLKYPEKSVYFADQLRFLQKLIINQRHKTQ